MNLWKFWRRGGPIPKLHADSLLNLRCGPQMPASLNQSSSLSPYSRWQMALQSPFSFCPVLEPWCIIDFNKMHFQASFAARWAIGLIRLPFIKHLFWARPRTKCWLRQRYIRFKHSPQTTWLPPVCYSLIWQPAKCLIDLSVNQHFSYLINGRTFGLSGISLSIEPARCIENRLWPQTWDV